MTKLAVALAFLGLNFYTYHYLATTPVIPERTPFAQFPRQVGDWRCDQPEVMAKDVQSNLGVTDYLLCSYARQDPDALIGLYVGYHESQVREQGGGAGENAIHPPAHCLPGSGWDIIDNQTITLDFEGMPTRPATVKRMLIARGEARQLTFYWYQSRGRVLSEDWKKIIYVGFDRAVKSRTDGSLIRFTLPVHRNEIAAAEAHFLDLAPQILALIPAYVPE